MNRRQVVTFSSVLALRPQLAARQPGHSLAFFAFLLWNSFHLDSFFFSPFAHIIRPPSISIYYCRGLAALPTSFILYFLCFSVSSLARLPFSRSTFAATLFPFFALLAVLYGGGWCVHGAASLVGDIFQSLSLFMFILYGAHFMCVCVCYCSPLSLSTENRLFEIKVRPSELRCTTLPHLLLLLKTLWAIILSR